jgi:hypothetical protein
VLNPQLIPYLIKQPRRLIRGVFIGRIRGVIIFINLKTNSYKNILELYTSEVLFQALFGASNLR